MNARSLACYFPLLALGVQLAQGAEPEVLAIPPQKVEGRIAWEYDYGQALAKAKAAGKPVWVVFRCER